MATFKGVILPHQKRNDGSYNVKIRVIHNRKTRYIKTPYYVGSIDISKRKKNGRDDIRIKNQAVIDSVDEIIMSYRRALIPYGMVVDSWDVDRVVDVLTSVGASFSLDFISYCRKYVERVKDMGRINTGRQYERAVNALIRFIGRQTLDISEITLQFLLSFENHLRNEPVYKGIRLGEAIPTNKPKKGRALSMYMSNIKLMYERAKMEYNDEDNGIINILYSPFSRYKIPQVQQSEHRTLTVEQIQKIIDMPYRKERRGLSQFNMAKDVFLLSFAMMGINTADLYEIEPFEGDILTYCRRKTRTRRPDKAEMSVRIEPEIMPLVRKYKGNGKAFMFSEHYSTPLNFNKLINQGLKKIGEEIGVHGLNYYYARHTMASICANVLGIDIARVDEMLNHSDSRLKLARVYIQRDFSPLWEANRRLIGLFDWSFYGSNVKK